MASTAPLGAARRRSRRLSAWSLWTCQLLETLTGPGKQGCSWWESVFEASLESSRSQAGPKLLSAPSIPAVTAQRTKTEASVRDRRPSIPPPAPCSPVPERPPSLPAATGPAGETVRSDRRERPVRNAGKRRTRALLHITSWWNLSGGGASSHLASGVFSSELSRMLEISIFPLFSSIKVLMIVTWRPKEQKEVTCSRVLSLKNSVLAA